MAQPRCRLPAPRRGRGLPRLPAAGPAAVPGTPRRAGSARLSPQRRVGECERVPPPDSRCCARYGAFSLVSALFLLSSPCLDTWLFGGFHGLGVSNPLGHQSFAFSPVPCRKALCWARQRMIVRFYRILRSVLHSRNNPCVSCTQM